MLQVISVDGSTRFVLNDVDLGIYPNNSIFVKLNNNYTGIVFLTLESRYRIVEGFFNETKLNEQIVTIGNYISLISSMYIITTDVTDLDPEIMAERFEQLIEALLAIAEGIGLDGLTDERFAALLEVLSKIGSMNAAQFTTLIDAIKSVGVDSLAIVNTTLTTGNTQALAHYVEAKTIGENIITKLSNLATVNDSINTSIVADTAQNLSLFNQYKTIQESLLEDLTDLKTALNAMKTSLSSDLGDIEGKIEDGFTTLNQSFALHTSRISGYILGVCEHISFLTDSTDKFKEKMETVITTLDTNVVTAIQDISTKLNWIKSSIDQATISNSTNLGSIRSAIETNIQFYASNVKGAIDANTTSTATKLSNIKDAIEADTTAITAKLSNINDAIEADTTSNNTKLGDIKTSIEADTTATTAKLGDIKTSIEADTTATTEKLINLKEAIEADTTATATKLSNIKDAIEADTTATTAKLTNIKDSIDADTIATTAKLGDIKTSIEADTTATTEKLSNIKDAIEADTTATAPKLTNIKDAIEADTTATAIKLTDLKTDLTAAIEAGTTATSTKLTDLKDTIKEVVEDNTTKVKKAIDDGSSIVSNRLSDVKDAIIDSSKYTYVEPIVIPEDIPGTTEIRGNLTLNSAVIWAVNPIIPLESSQDIATVIPSSVAPFDNNIKKQEHYEYSLNKGLTWVGSYPSNAYTFYDNALHAVRMRTSFYDFPAKYNISGSIEVYSNTVFFFVGDPIVKNGTTPQFLKEINDSLSNLNLNFDTDSIVSSNDKIVELLRHAYTEPVGMPDDIPFEHIVSGGDYKIITHSPGLEKRIVNLGETISFTNPHPAEFVLIAENAPAYSLSFDYSNSSKIYYGYTDGGENLVISHTDNRVTAPPTINDEHHEFCWVYCVETNVKIKDNDDNLVETVNLTSGKTAFIVGKTEYDKVGTVPSLLKDISDKLLKGGTTALSDEQYQGLITVIGGIGSIGGGTGSTIPEQQDISRIIYWSQLFFTKPKIDGTTKQFVDSLIQCIINEEIKPHKTMIIDGSLFVDMPQIQNGNYLPINVEIFNINKIILTAYTTYPNRMEYRYYKIDNIYSGWSLQLTDKNLKGLQYESILKEGKWSKPTGSKYWIYEYYDPTIHADDRVVIWGKDDVDNDECIYAMVNHTVLVANGKITINARTKPRVDITIIMNIDGILY
jgi:hypothetical protein